MIWLLNGLDVNAITGRLHIIVCYSYNSNDNGDNNSSSHSFRDNI